MLPKSQIEKESIAECLGGIFQNYKPDKSYDSFEAMKKEAFDDEMREKYGA
ncbi:MAG: hypothetical protein U9N52_05710 [Campylobacterota bacterium]|nr:hypothetical protein [Campylobacterota bacterium]